MEHTVLTFAILSNLGYCLLKPEPDSFKAKETTGCPKGSVTKCTHTLDSWNIARRAGLQITEDSLPNPVSRHDTGSNISLCPWSRRNQNRINKVLQIGKRGYQQLISIDYISNTALCLHPLKNDFAIRVFHDFKNGESWTFLGPWNTDTHPQQTWSSSVTQ